MPKNASLTKTDLVNYIGPIFEDLKTDIRKVEGRLTDKINWQGTLVDEMRRDILTALEASSPVLEEEETVKEHGERIALLERDVEILKAVKKS